MGTKDQGPRKNKVGKQSSNIRIAPRQGRLFEVSTQMSPLATDVEGVSVDQMLFLNDQVVMISESFVTDRFRAAVQESIVLNQPPFSISRLKKPVKTQEWEHVYTSIPSIAEMNVIREKLQNKNLTDLKKGSGFIVVKVRFNDETKVIELETENEQGEKRKADANRPNQRSMVIGFQRELFTEETLVEMHKQMTEVIYANEMVTVRQYEAGMGTLANAINGGQFGQSLNKLCGLDHAASLIAVLPSSDRRQLLLEAVYHYVLSTCQNFNWNVDFIANHYQWAVLQVQASKSHYEQCMWLLDHGANLRFRETKGYTALAIAAASNAVTAVEMFLARDADPCELSNDQTTALHLAAALGHRDVVIVLCDKKYGVSLNAVNAHNMTPLLLSVQNGHVNVVKTLLKSAKKEKVGAEALILEMLNSSTNAGWTSLHFAASLNHPSAVAILMQHGGNPLQIDARGWTPLACAVQENHVEVVRKMLDFAREKDLMQEVYRVHNELKVSLVHLAAASKACQTPEMITLLLENGFDAAPRAQFVLPDSTPALSSFDTPKSPADLAVEHGKSEAFLEALLPSARRPGMR